ncbi:CGNR zinc finger domain-containing protein [Gracilibacillus caseinilyticus]|uniref:CGNR zinc finger domain-containing protein n=1 Tax=Gracilibacillus caseinilyticus TaxID=2932256 RepID=A0ABY4EZM6_9BACI|nr:CGNR zinc finger domain-containing protein [Gracilibacillus caseinilyticus]UOQ49323.1 CGNR zinc finger domain-containing protein [Gracilibacillus caseinilyticus]
MAVEQKFPLISGNISIDLVNTEVVRHGTRHDLLTNTKHVLAWFDTLIRENIIFKEQFSKDIEQRGNDALILLHELRSFLREGYEKMADGKELSSDWINHLELLIKNAPFTYQFKDDKLIPTPMGKPENALTSLIALDALKLISSGQLSNIHRCANPDCVLLFIDTHGRRKWCSMKICGNRSKVTRHQRHKAQKN